MNTPSIASVSQLVAVRRAVAAVSTSSPQAQTMNVHRNTKVIDGIQHCSIDSFISPQLEDIFGEFHRLREDELFTDMELVAAGSSRTEERCRRVHSLVLAASSEFIKQWIESMPVSGLGVSSLLSPCERSASP